MFSQTIIIKNVSDINSTAFRILMMVGGQLTRCNQSLFARLISQDGQREIRQAREYNNNAKVDSERIKIELIQVAYEPAHEEIVCNRKEPSSAESIIRADISHDCKLRANRHVRADELPE